MFSMYVCGYLHLIKLTHRYDVLNFNLTLHIILLFEINQMLNYVYFILLNVSVKSVSHRPFIHYPIILTYFYFILCKRSFNRILIGPNLLHRILLLCGNFVKNYLSFNYHWDYILLYLNWLLYNNWI